MFKKSLTVSGVALALIVGGSVVSAQAASADTADTSITAAVASGGLSISAPGTADFGAITPGQIGHATLEDVTVTDLRAGTAGWAASATVSDFTSETLGTTISGSNATYTPTAATTSGSADVVASATVGGADGGAVQTASEVTGNNTASWDAAIALAVPSDALAADDYTATLTHSVA